MPKFRRLPSRPKTHRTITPSSPSAPPPLEEHRKGSPSTPSFPWGQDSPFWPSECCDQQPRKAARGPATKFQLVTIFAVDTGVFWLTLPSPCPWANRQRNPSPLGPRLPPRKSDGSSYCISSEKLAGSSVLWDAKPSCFHPLWWHSGSQPSPGCP